MKIIYHLNGGHFNYKDEVKRVFYLDLFNFVNDKNPSVLEGISFTEFVSSQPYVIGNLAKNFYLEEKVGSKLEEQSSDYFIGYCYKQGKYQKLIPHLIHFFALWRDIEGCREEFATDFFASSWAALVDSAKFFKYTTEDDLKNSPEAPAVRDVRILNSIQNCPELITAPTEVLLGEKSLIPHPRKIGYNFLGWFADQGFRKQVEVATGREGKLNLYAKWGTYTYFHANDGYLKFEDIYEDFLRDFSLIVGSSLTKEKTWEGENGWVSDFCKKSSGYLNKFFAISSNHQKWFWLVEYVAKLYDATPESKKDFDYFNGAFVNEDHLRWEFNSLFVSRYHVVYPKTKDYSGAGIKEKIALQTNSFHLRLDYAVGDEVALPNVDKSHYKLIGWYSNPQGLGERIVKINDDSFATLTLYAKWQKA